MSDGVPTSSTAAQLAEILNELKFLRTENEERSRENSDLCKFFERHLESSDRGSVRGEDVLNIIPEQVRSRSPTSSNREIQVVKLTKLNYRLWSKEITIVLKEIDLLGCCLGEPKFAGTIHERRYTDKDKDKVYRIIFQSCDAFHRELIVDIVDPRLAWERLNEFHVPVNISSRINSVTDFFGVKMGLSEDMETYIRRFNLLYQSFIASGNAPVEEALVAQVLLIGLPSSYSNVRSNVNAMPIQDLSRNRVESLLLSEWHQRNLLRRDNFDNTTRHTSINTRNATERIRCIKCGNFEVIETYPLCATRPWGDL
jgi:hypothetical protein